MSVTVTTVDGGYDEPRRVRFHNGFGWFLDSVFVLIGDTRAPRALFSQAIGPGENPAPGDLTPHRALAFAALIDEQTDEQLEALMWRALDGRSADPDMGPAIATVRQLADLARYSADHGGLTFR